jgi:hypothetical protein
LGLKVRDEILQSFGDNVRFFFSAGANGAANATALIQVKDSQKAAKTFEKLMQIAQQILAADAQANPMSPKLEKTTISGKEAYTLSSPAFGMVPGAPPVSPSICLTEKELIIASTTQGVESYLSRPADFKSLAQSPDIAKLLADESAPTAFIYQDAPRVFGILYSLLPGAAAMLKTQGINLDLSLVPPKESVLGHLTPMISTLRRTTAGIELTDRTPVPGWTNTTPIVGVAVAALVLPAFQAAREAARRAQSQK